MAQINPQQLLAAAMASGSGSPTGAPMDAQSNGAGGTTPAGAAQGLADTMPGLNPAAQATGASAAGSDVGGTASGGPGNVDLSALLGSGSDLSQDPNAIQQMTAMLQDPSTPPDQKAQIQMRLQLAALASLAQNPVGSQQAQAQGA